MTRVYRVSGMTCEGCVRSVTRAIGRVAPGAAVAIDLPAGKVTVEGDVGEAEIARAVANAGFTFEGAA
jgi:copper chaperone